VTMEFILSALVVAIPISICMYGMFHHEIGLLASWLATGCWHDFHRTGRRGKRSVDNHGKFGDRVHIMIEGECCKCQRTKWIPQYIPGDHGNVDTYSSNSLPKLEYV